MRKLEEEFTRKGFTYKLVQASQYAFLYAQYGPGMQLLGYEVFEYRINPAREIEGKAIEESEAWPPDEAFGQWAWTYKIFKSAVARFNWIEQRVKARLAAQSNVQQEVPVSPEEEYNSYPF